MLTNERSSAANNASFTEILATQTDVSLHSLFVVAAKELIRWRVGVRIRSGTSGARELFHLFEIALHVVAWLDLLRFAQEFGSFGVFLSLREQLRLLHESVGFETDRKST